jgi:hypothetical protein
LGIEPYAVKRTLSVKEVIKRLSTVNVTVRSLVENNKRWLRHIQLRKVCSANEVTE